MNLKRIVVLIFLTYPSIIEAQSSGGKNVFDIACWAVPTSAVMSGFAWWFINQKIKSLKQIRSIAALSESIKNINKLDKEIHTIKRYKRIAKSITKGAGITSACLILYKILTSDRLLGRFYSHKLSPEKQREIDLIHKGFKHQLQSLQFLINNAESDHAVKEQFNTPSKLISEPIDLDTSVFTDQRDSTMVVFCPGDGDCALHALISHADEATLRRINEHTSMSEASIDDKGILRKAVIDKIRQKFEAHELTKTELQTIQSKTKKRNPTEALDLYKATMLQAKQHGFRPVCAWFDDLEISFAATILEKPIFIWSQINKKITLRTIHGMNFLTKNTHLGKNVAHLIHTGGHYNILNAGAFMDMMPGEPQI